MADVGLLPDLSVDGFGEEGDVCRVCRVEADDEAPFIHPCKCSGSVRFVHHDCLKNWLAHSQKKYCEICGHKYAFTKVYPEHLPAIIPAVVYVRQTALWLYRIACHTVRFWLAVLVWLVLLPSANMITLRSLIWLADQMVQPSLGAGSPLGEGSTAVNDTLALAANATGLAANETASEDGVLLWDLLLRPASTGGKLLYASWDSWYNGDQNTYLPNSLFGNADIGTSVPGFIFRGQILSITLAAVLIGFILLREWITQHNWAEHDPRPVRKEADLEPDQWTVRGGVAFRNEDVLAAFGHSAETGPLTASAAGGQGDQSLRASSQKIEDIIDRLTAVPSGRVSILSDDRRAHLADALKRMKEDIDGHDAENEKHRRIDAQKKMSVWHPVLNLESLDHPTNPISNGNDVVRSASSSSFQPRSPISSPPAGDDSFSTDRASAGPSRPSAISVSPYQFRLPPHSATATSASDPNPESDLRLTPALTSPGGGPPRPAAPLKAVAGLAYTAPEMLSPKGKGKVQAIEVFGEYVEDVSGPNTGPDSDKAAHDDRPNGDVLKGIVPFSDGDGAEPPPAYNDGRPIIGDPPDTAVPDDRMKISIGADFSATSDDSPTLRDPNKLDDQPQDLAYRDLSSGQQSPSTVSASTIPASGDDSAVTSPHVEAIALAEEPGEVDHAAPRVLEAPFGPENRQANGEDVDVQFIADDEEEAHWEREDWDGVLEVIGLIGPLQGMLQNVVFANIIMGASLTVLVGMPIIIGKVFLALDLVRSFLYTSHLVLRGARSVTDPVVDVLVDITKDVILLPMMSVLNATDTSGLGRFGLDRSSYAIGSHLSDALRGNEQGGTRPGDLLALVSNHTFDSYQAYRALCVQVAKSDRMSDRVWCMVTGYLVCAFFILIVALAGQAGLGRISAGVAAQVKQHTTFAKLSFFMALELVLFPLGIGMVIDACTVPLFAGASLAGGLRHLRTAPFGVVFVSWLIGTLFMFTFANILGHIRTICRPGAMFFIRDPSDQNYSPVKDIIERPAGSQLRKLGISAIMYMILVFWLIGGTCWGLRYQPFVEILPLRLHSFGPMSSVPFDVLFLHLVLPASVDSLQPRHRLKNAWSVYWRTAASAFHLTSLMYGRRQPAKEDGGSSGTEGIWPILDKPFQLLFGQYKNTQTDARVPGADQIVLLSPAERRKGGVFVPVDPQGATRTPEDKLRLLKQDRAAREAGRDPKTDYTVIWLPRYWRTKIHAFIVVTLTTVSITLALGCFVPLVVGRAAMAMLFTESTHDGYNLVVGGYICWFAYNLGRRAGKWISQSNKAGRLHRSNFSTRSKRVIFATLSNIYAVLVLYLVLPGLVGIVFELYVGMPGRYGARIQVTPVLHFWDAWAMGTIIDSLFVGMMSVLVRRQRRHPLHHHHHHHRHLRYIRNDRRPRLEQLRDFLRKPLHNNFHSLNAILLPVIGYVLIPIIAPCGISTGMLLLMADKWSTDINAVFFRSTFPAALIFLLALTSRRALSTRIGLFRQRLIDAEYVVEERVENYEPKLTGTAVSGDTVKQVESLVEVMDPDGSDTGDRADWEEDAVDLDVEGDESEGILSQAETEELG